MSEQSFQVLVEIPPSEWKILRELYTERRTEPSGYYLIDYYMKLIAKEPDCNVKCFSLDGDWKTDGTFLIIINDDTYKLVYLNTLSDNLERLTKALLCLAYTGDYKLHDYEERLLPAVEIFKKNAVNKELKTTQAVWLTVSKKNIINFSTVPPLGITVRSLESKDVPSVTNIWQNGSGDAVAFIKRLIAYNVSVGAFDTDGKLVAFCMRLPIGALGVLHVVESHRRLGLGSLMVRCLSKKIFELGDEVLAAVLIENTASRKMFEKLGFNEISNVYWTV